MSERKNIKATVLSDGAWGTALAMVLCDNGYETTLWGPFPEYIEQMRAERVNSRFLSSVPLPETLRLESDIANAVDAAEIIVLASPSQYMRGTLEKLAPRYHSRQLLVNVAKGIEVGSLKMMHELCADILGDNSFSVLSGPSHAEEVAKKAPTAVMVACDDGELARTAQSAFMNDYFRVYTASDVIGAELGGALKNVFAIAAGIIDGMKLGDNAKAALMTRGLAELTRLGVALGGAPETFAGLSGMGDLIVTCASGHSRNRHVGEELGRGKKLPDILREMGMVVAEGVKTAESAYQLASKAEVETPIIHEIYTALYHGKDPREAVGDLMTRKARPERDNHHH